MSPSAELSSVAFATELIKGIRGGMALSTDVAPLRFHRDRHAKAFTETAAQHQGFDLM